jgi:hypothetical protein
MTQLAGAGAKVTPTGRYGGGIAACVRHPI